jgi:hypothetical protein
MHKLEKDDGKTQKGRIGTYGICCENSFFPYQLCLYKKSHLVFNSLSKAL